MKQHDMTLARPRMDPSAFSGTPHRRIAVIVGALFILQIVTFAVGASLIETYLSGEAAKPTLVMGVLLEMCSGVAIVAIGLMMYRVLRVVDPRWALGYPVMRVTEFTVSALLAWYLLTQLEEFPNHLLWIYLPTGIGGLILNYLFFVSGLVPRAIAVLGLVGYALLSLTVPLDLVGAIDVESGAGLLMLAPGGLYEFLVLPIWLFARGFRTPYAS
jgi:hypothetical protein